MEKLKIKFHKQRTIKGAQLTAFAYLLCRGVYSLYEFAPTDYLQILGDARPQL